MYHRLLQEREEDYLDVAKILVLNGSPHKSASTTMAVTNAFVKGMCEGGEYESEIINISDLNVTPCMGCLSCWARTEGECVIKNDDMPAVKKRIEEADIIIESYPLYFFGMPGQMKLFTDRLLSMMCTYRGQKPPENGESFHGIRNPKTGQKLVLISGCAYSESESVYDSLLKEYECICGKNGKLSHVEPFHYIFPDKHTRKLDELPKYHKEPVWALFHYDMRDPLDHQALVEYIE